MNTPQKPRRSAAPKPRRIQSAQAAIELWNAFSSNGRLAENSHDRVFMEKLRRGIGADAGEEIVACLARRRLSTNEFLAELLNGLEPWSNMLSDIYTMFERHGVIHSNESVLIAFEYGAGTELKFDAGHFRKARAILSELESQVGVRKWSECSLRALGNEILGALGAAVPGSVTERYRQENGKPLYAPSEPKAQAFRDWVAAGSTAAGFHWLYDAPPPLPTWSAGDPLAVLQEVSRAVQSICSACARYRDWNALRTAANADAPAPSPEPLMAIRDWGPRALRHAEQDYFVRHLLADLWHVQESAPEDPAERAKLGAHVAKAIEDHSELVKLPGRQLSEVLEDLMDLPLWKSREQVYSIWLVALVDALLSPRCKIELVHGQGALTFRFARTPVARISSPGVRLELVAELKTHAEGIALTGKGRTHHIQPDYVFLQQAGGARHAPMVLEAKQYATADVANFSKALFDYARVHRDAIVALANYGPVTKEAVLQAVASAEQAAGAIEVASRCRIFGDLRPCQAAPVREFQEALETLFAAPVGELRLLVDVSSSMKPHFTSPARARFWRTLGEAAAQTFLVADRVYLRADVPMGQPVARAAELQVQPYQLDLKALDDGWCKGALLVTDASGAVESSADHAELSAVVVLEPGGGYVRINDAAAPPWLVALAQRLQDCGLRMETAPGLKV